ncbi:hypothetical protein EDC04DRAFT_713438 [Pisolithus marmoratus]|nr:hypothetical protein EDC04DRAFT_713438 [Pisolithus marmoratus]
MVIIPEKSELARTGVDGEQPPAYDAIEELQSTNPSPTSDTLSSSLHVAPTGSSNSPSIVPTSRRFLHPSHSDGEHSLTPRRSADFLTNIPARGRARLQKARQRHSSSWLSFLPFTSAHSAKQVRQSILTIIHDLVVPPNHSNLGSPPDAHEILASCSNTCIEHKLSLSEIVQELSIADHTPMYWAIVNYREALLVALLTFAEKLGSVAVSDIRRACLVSSNQPLFHALRAKRLPFHRTHGLRVPSLHAANESLLLGSRPADEVRVQESGQDGAFIVGFDVVLWQRRMRAVGRTSVEFIVSGRMWRVTFFSTDAPSLNGGRGKLNRDTWHVMVTLLESSPPAYLDARLIIDVPPPPPPPLRLPRSDRAQGIRPTLPRQPISPRTDKNWQNPQVAYDYNYDGMAQRRFSSFQGNSMPQEKPYHHDKGLAFPLSHHSSCTFSQLPPPIHQRGTNLQVETPPMMTASAPTIRLRSHAHKLARYGRPAFDSPDTYDALNTRVETWSDNGVSYTSAVIAPLAEGAGSQLQYEKSPYLFADGTLRARLEARLTKSELSRDCIIC